MVMAIVPFWTEFSRFLMKIYRVVSGLEFQRIALLGPAQVNLPNAPEARRGPATVSDPGLGSRVVLPRESRKHVLVTRSQTSWRVQQPGIFDECVLN